MVVQGRGQGCEIVLAHSLICRKTNKEFIIDRPDLAFVQRLADHVAYRESGEGGRAPCIFCSAEFTRNELQLHFSEHSEAIATALRYSFNNLQVSPLVLNGINSPVDSEMLLQLSLYILNISFKFKVQ